MAEATNPVEQFVDREFPIQFRHLLPSAMRLAYAKVDETIETLEWLQNPSGRYQRGQLIVKAVEAVLHKLACDGNLPFDAKWESYAAPTGKHLVLYGDQSRLTINQISEPKSKPRYAKFRSNFGIYNTALLFKEWNDEAERKDRMRHLLILHGYKDLTFVNIGFPHPDKDRLIYSTSNLVNMPHVAASGNESEQNEGPTESPDLETLEEIERFLRDNKLT